MSAPASRKPREKAAPKRASLYAQGFKRVDVFLYGAILVAFLAGLFGGYNVNGQHLVKVKVPVATKVQIGGYADIVKALGKPDTVVDGAQVNSQLAGTKCAVYQAKKLVVCGA
jgi:hypothetical protein